jgi:hypothetical protein
MPGPPPLRPFGLVLHHDGRWTHEGEPILHRKMREHFDGHVRWLPDERKYVVFLRHFRGEIEVEEAGFFVRDLDPASGEITLSDGAREALDCASLRASPIDGAWLCTVKRDLAPGGLPARLLADVQAALASRVEERDGRLGAVFAGEFRAFPELLD